MLRGEHGGGGWGMDNKNILPPAQTLGGKIPPVSHAPYNTHTHTHIYIYSHIHTHKQTHICIYIYLCMCAHTHTLTHAYTHICIYIYLCMYAQYVLDLPASCNLRFLLIFQNKHLVPFNDVFKFIAYQLLIQDLLIN